MNRCRVDYQYDEVGDVIVIFDLDSGRSVTHDIGHVLQEIHHDIGDFGGRPVIYRDTRKVFDGVSHDGVSGFTGFYPIGETVMEVALKCARGERAPLVAVGR